MDIEMRGYLRVVVVVIQVLAGLAKTHNAIASVLA